MFKSNQKHIMLPIAMKAGVGYLVGNIFLRGISFLTTPVFTRIMIPEAYGKYTIYLSYESFFSIIMLLGLSGSIRRAKIDYEKRFEEYISNISFIVTTNGIIVLVIVNILYLSGIKLFGYEWSLINILVLHCYFDNLLHIYSVKLSATYNYHKYLAISFASSFINIILSLLLIRFVFGVRTEYGRIIGTFVSLAGVGIYVATLIIKENKNFFSKEIWQYAIRYSLPLMIHSISLTILSQFDRIMISRIIGFAQAGIYSVIYSFGGVLSLIWGSLDTSWSQWVFDKLQYNKNETVRKTGKMYIRIIFMLTVCGMLIIPEILKLMISEEYHSGISLFAPICSGVFLNFLYTFYVQIENFCRKTKFIALGTIMAGLINIFLNMIFISIYGYVAAAYTTIVSYFLLLLFHICTVKFVIKKDIYCDVEMILTGVMIIISGIVVNMLLAEKFIRLILAIIIVSVIVLYFRFTIKNIKGESYYEILQ